MSKMREIDGYMTLEASMVLPVVFFVFLIFIGFAFYVMNCGIAQGIMEEEGRKAADTVVSNGNSEDGSFSYVALNQRNLYTQMLPGKSKAGKTIKAAVDKSLRERIFCGKTTKVSAKMSLDQMTVNVSTSLPLPGVQFLSGFGIQFFVYEGECKISYMTEIEKIRRWSVIERAMD